MEKMSEEPKPGVSKKGVMEDSSSSREEIEEIDPSCITDELLQKYASEMPSEIPMTISEELFYSDAMVQREYERLSEEDKKRFDQMKVLAEKIKKETGQYVPIEDMMARVVAQRFGHMTQQNVATVLGPSGEGPAAGKVLEKKGDILRIKVEEGSKEERKVVLTVLVPNEDPACLAYCIEEDEDAPECVSIASEDSDFAVQKPEVQAILQELASLKRKEADCYDWLMAAIPDMTDEEVTEVGERVWPSKLPKCADQLYDRLKNPRNFRTVLAVGERMFSLYKHEQAGEPVVEVPELCERMKYFEAENIRKKCLLPSQKVPNQPGGLQLLSSERWRKHLEERGMAKSLRKTLCKALRKTNSGPYGTTNSSQREYKLKS